MTNYPRTRPVRRSHRSMAVEWGLLIGAVLMLVFMAVPVVLWFTEPAHGFSGETPYAGESYSAVMPPCVHEDGSGQDGCVWRANVYGNGRGHSLLAWADGTVEYVSHKRARRIVRAWRNQNCTQVTRRDWSCPRRAWNYTKAGA